MVGLPACDSTSHSHSASPRLDHAAHSEGDSYICKHTHMAYNNIKNVYMYRNDEIGYIYEEVNVWEKKVVGWGGGLGRGKEIVKSLS